MRCDLLTRSPSHSLPMCVAPVLLVQQFKALDLCDINEYAHAKISTGDIITVVAIYFFFSRFRFYTCLICMLLRKNFFHVSIK